MITLQFSKHLLREHRNPIDLARDANDYRTYRVTQEHARYHFPEFAAGLLLSPL